MKISKYLWFVIISGLCCVADLVTAKQINWLLACIFAAALGTYIYQTFKDTTPEYGDNGK